MKNNRFVYFVLLPIFLLLAVFFVLPIVGGFAISFFDYNPLRTINHFIGFENFGKLMSDKIFLKSTTNTLVFVGITVTLNIIITLVLAQLISMLPWPKLRSFFRVIFFMPCVAPLIASSVVWGGLYATKYGLINNFLKTFFGFSPVNWLGTASYVMPAIIIFTLWADIGYNIILFSAGMDGIPSDFYEAAEIDGAGMVKKFFYITLPLLGRTVSFVVAMTIISHFQMFAQFQVLAKLGGPENSGNVLTYYIYKTAFQTKDMGYASAIAVVLFILIMIVTVIQQRLNRVEWGY